MSTTCDADPVVSRTASVRSLGSELERVRLQRRVLQLQIVIDRLSRRVNATDAGQFERAGLKRTIGDFRDELASMRDRLAEIAALQEPEPHPGPRGERLIAR